MLIVTTENITAILADGLSQVQERDMTLKVSTLTPKEVVDILDIENSSDDGAIVCYGQVNVAEWVSRRSGNTVVHKEYGTSWLPGDALLVVVLPEKFQDMTLDKNVLYHKDTAFLLFQVASFELEDIVVFGVAP